MVLDEIDKLYDPLFHQAIDLQYKFHDYTAGANHPEAYALQNEIHQLVGDIHSRRDPGHIERRIATIQRQLKQAEHAPQPFIHYSHSDSMYKNYEQMRQGVRKFPNF
jgi:hypothetical protein